jgi:transposase
MDKSERFGFVLTPTEKRILGRLAEMYGGLSKAATLRRLIRQEAKNHGLWPNIHDAKRTEGQEGQHD